MKVPSNFSFINNETLEVKIIPGEYSKIENLGFKWELK